MSVGDCGDHFELLIGNTPVAVLLGSMVAAHEMETLQKCTSQHRKPLF